MLANMKGDICGKIHLLPSGLFKNISVKQELETNL